MAPPVSPALVFVLPGGRRLRGCGASGRAGATGSAPESHGVAAAHGGRVGGGWRPGAAGMARAEVLVANFGQTPDSYIVLGGATDAAQGFTTGPRAGGYLLSGIDAKFRTTAGDPWAPSVTVHSGSLNGATIATLSGSATVDEGVERFTASGEVRLDPDTTYYVRFEGGTYSVGVRTTRSYREDAGNSAGWRIGDKRHWRLALSTGSFEHDPGSILIRVNGSNGPVGAGDRAAGRRPTGGAGVD